MKKSTSEMSWKKSTSSFLIWKKKRKLLKKKNLRKTYKKPNLNRLINSPKKYYEIKRNLRNTMKKNSPKKHFVHIGVNTGTQHGDRLPPRLVPSSPHSPGGWLQLYREFVHHHILAYDGDGSCLWFCDRRDENIDCETRWINSNLNCKDNLI